MLQPPLESALPRILPRLQRRAAAHRRLGARLRPLPGRRRDLADVQGRRLGEPLALPGHGGVGVEILDWPGTAVRLVAKERDELFEVADTIRAAWEVYDDEALGIASHDASGARQSALSPSVIRIERGYEMSLIFRNNAVSDEFPEGVFHAHPEFWPVKQEPIGLIEAQGLFILPGRLVD